MSDSQAAASKFAVALLFLTGIYSLIVPLVITPIALSANTQMGQMASIAVSTNPRPVLMPKQSSPTAGPVKDVVGAAPGGAGEVPPNPT